MVRRMLPGSSTTQCQRPRATGDNPRNEAGTLYLKPPGSYRSPPQENISAVASLDYRELWMNTAKREQAVPHW